jgi:hypothetical protein
MTAELAGRPPGADINGNTAGAGPKYFVDIEGSDYPWDQATITAAGIRELAGWPDDQQVVEVDLATNIEHTLAEDEAIELKPGHGFGRKISFKRGTR